ncbi:unnamed protein product [Mesocestoides corti]|uniref:Claspin n=1 Tax=Mesocestoides corti TaxID=53468 RepID=A0A0R3UQ75_MESCO|nr:unnamed protein product [Mesocestoides corti]
MDTVDAAIVSNVKYAISPISREESGRKCPTDFWNDQAVEEKEGDKTVCDFENQNQASPDEEEANSEKDIFDVIHGEENLTEEIDWKICCPVLPDEVAVCGGEEVGMEVDQKENEHDANVEELANADLAAGDGDETCKQIVSGETSQENTNEETFASPTDKQTNDEKMIQCEENLTNENDKEMVCPVLPDEEEGRMGDDQKEIEDGVSEKDLAAGDSDETSGQVVSEEVDLENTSEKTAESSIHEQTNDVKAVQSEHLDPSAVDEANQPCGVMSESMKTTETANESQNESVVEHEVGPAELPASFASVTGRPRKTAHGRSRVKLLTFKLLKRLGYFEDREKSGNYSKANVSSESLAGNCQSSAGLTESTQRKAHEKASLRTVLSRFMTRLRSHGIFAVFKSHKTKTRMERTETPHIIEFQEQSVPASVMEHPR